MDNISSTLGQLRQGRPVELVDISGEGKRLFLDATKLHGSIYVSTHALCGRSVIREANAIGLKAPVNRLLLELVGVLETTKARRLPVQRQLLGK